LFVRSTRTYVYVFSSEYFPRQVLGLNFSNIWSYFSSEDDPEDADFEPYDAADDGGASKKVW